MQAKKGVVLVAGGTGGHLFPALSVAQVWTKKDVPVMLYTDERAQGWAQRKDAPWKVVVNRFTGSSGQRSGLRGRMAFALQLLRCGLKSLVTFLWNRPAIVIGFGGYPSAPVVLAAWILRIPYMLHECNASLGRANDILLKGAKVLTVGFDVSIPQATQKGTPLLFTGNPIREDIARLADRGITPEQGTDTRSDKKAFRLLIIGGSQGASLFSQVVPEALRLLCTNRPGLVLEVHEQVRPHDLPQVDAFYQSLTKETQLVFDLRPFFEDMPERLSEADLVIARSGALTLAELAAAGCPSILVPLARSNSKDQTANAERFRQKAAAIVLEEAVFTPRHLCFILNTLLQAPEALREMKVAARNLFTPKASERLVEVAESILNTL